MTGNLSRGIHCTSRNQNHNPRLNSACNFISFLFILTVALLTGRVSAAANVSAELRGYNSNARMSWVSINLSNPMSRPLEGYIEFSSYGYGGGNNTVRLEMAPLPPGSTRLLNVPVPLENLQNGVLYEPNGDMTNLNVNPGYMASDNHRAYLFVAEQANRPTEEEMDTFTYRVLPNQHHLFSTSYSGGSSASTTRTLTAAERAVTHIKPEELPENWLCYVPLQYVMMEESLERRLTAPQRQALYTWVDLGGTLVLYGNDELRTEHRKRGTIDHRPENPLTDASFTAQSYSDPMGLGQTVKNINLPYKVNTAGGRGGAFLLATLFLIVAGPVNYFYFLRRNEIRKLIVTVPLISLGFCSLIAVYFVLTQGFNRRGGSISLTTVDESTNRAVTLARHSLLSGLYPLGGFHFGQETYFVPKVDQNPGASEMNLTRGLALTQGLFKPGIAFDYATITPHTTREKMIYDPEASTLRNGFELPVKAVAVLHDKKYYTGGAVAPGGQVDLKAVDDASVVSMDNYPGVSEPEVASLVYLLGRQTLETTELDTVSGLARDTIHFQGITTGTIYAAIFDGVPKTSDAGLEITDGNNLHILVGIAAPGESEE